jgi:drug/metabolite transporter (DMT)-like permease
LWIGVVASLVAGLFFAGGSVLQQRMAATRPEGETLSPKLLWSLAHSKVWLAGIGAGIVSYVLQALALSAAPLSVVQPLLVSEVLFAIPLSVRIHKKRLRGLDRAGVLAVTVGLAGAIVAAKPTKGRPLAPLPDWGILIGVVAVVVGVALAGGRRSHGVGRPSLFAFAAAMAMALEASLMSASTVLYRRGVLHLLTAWQPYVMVVSTLTGLLLIQSAFQAGPLASSMPVGDATEPLVAIAIGIGMFGEHVAHSTWRLALSCLGIALLLAGIIELDTSPVVQALHESGK